VSAVSVVIPFARDDEAGVRSGDTPRQGFPAVKAPDEEGNRTSIWAAIGSLLFIAYLVKWIVTGSASFVPSGSENRDADGNRSRVQTPPPAAEPGADTGSGQASRDQPVPRGRALTLDSVAYKVTSVELTDVLRTPLLWFNSSGRNVRAS
jgi:hypothetical protein